MNFCPKCEFMLYTKTSNEESNKLINYCKNCFWSGDYITDNSTKISVYKKNYSDDYISHSIYTNPNIIYDNTLPRINNIKCINDSCISNINDTQSLTIQIDNTMNKEEAIINDIPFTDIEQVCIDFLQDKMTEKPNITKIAKNICIVTNISKHVQDDLMKQTTSQYNNMSITISPFTKKKNEIIFIKYNKSELKYMYICAHCKSSWKN